MLIPIFGIAQNQTMRINLELPAGVGLSSGSNSMTGFQMNQLSEDLQSYFGMKNSFYLPERDSYVQLYWIKMQAYENSQFFLDFRSKCLIEKSELFYFLNDDTYFIEFAQALQEIPVLLNFNKQGLLLRSFVPKKNRLTFWFGFYSDCDQKTLLLEYF